MAKPEMQPEKAAVTVLDIRIMVSVAICFITAAILKSIGFLFPYGEMRLEIIQTMTSCIACLLCCQDTTVVSAKAGKNRLIITAIGGAVGMLVAWIDTIVGQTWLLACMIALGVLLTLFLCKAAKVPYINARIGGVTFILVACTLSGTARLVYALFRFVSTLYGVLVVLLVTYLFSLFTKKPE